MHIDKECQPTWSAHLMLTIVAALAIVLVNVTGSVGSASPLLRTVALSGQPAPGTSNAVSFDTFNQPVINAAGKIGFLGFLKSP
jgi:hypothetical protein